MDRPTRDCVVVFLRWILVMIAIAGRAFAVPPTDEQVKNLAKPYMQIENRLDRSVLKKSARFKASKRVTKTIWLSLRTDGKPGTGRAEDPFDCGVPTGTADTRDLIKASKYDAIIRRCLKAGDTNWVVNLGEGTFYTRGAHSNTVFSWACSYPDKIKLVGQGIYKTTLKLATYPDTWASATSSRAKWSVIDGRVIKGVTTGGIILENFTVDCNWTAIKAQMDADHPTSPNAEHAIGAATLAGSNNHACNMRFINPYGHSETNTECFALAFGTGYSSTFLTSDNNIAERCLFELPQGNYQTAIAFTGHSNSQRMTNSKAINCQAFGDPTSTGVNRIFSTGLVNMAYVKGVIVEGCETSDGTGVYNDTGEVDDLWVRRNQFKRCRGIGAGISHVDNNLSFSNIHFDDNYVEVRNEGNNIPAVGRLISDGTAPANGSTVTIGTAGGGGKTYTFRTTLTPTEGEVLIGANAASALNNLHCAINHTGRPDVDYQCAAANIQVEASNVPPYIATQKKVQALTPGLVGNSIETSASASPASHLSWGTSTLTGGRNGHSFGLLLSAAAPTTFTNCSINRNTIVKLTDGTSALNYRAISNSGTFKNLQVWDNRGDSTMEWKIDDGETTSYQGNRDFKGEMITYPVGPRKRPHL